MSGIYDVLNRFYLDIEIERISNSENELAKQNLSHLKEMKLKQPILVIFARGMKIRKKHPERYEHMKEKTQARISVSELPSRKDLVLMTRLPTVIAPEQLSDLYYRRRKIEKRTAH